MGGWREKGDVATVVEVMVRPDNSRDRRWRYVGFGGVGKKGGNVLDNRNVELGRGRSGLRSYERSEDGWEARLPVSANGKVKQSVCCGVSARVPMGDEEGVRGKGHGDKARYRR